MHATAFAVHEVEDEGAKIESYARKEVDGEGLEAMALTVSKKGPTRGAKVVT